MTRTTRPLAGLIAGAATLALAVPTAAVAQDATPTADAASWLVDQLVDGDHLEGEFGPQYGPTADVAYGLLTSGEQPDTLTDVLDYMTTSEAVDSYVHGQPFDGTDVDDPTYVGANAKLGLLVTLADRDPRDVAGDDLVENMLSLEDEDTGAFEDRSDFGNFANVFGQSFALLFLTGASDVTPSDASVDYLVDAQCDDGGFPESFGGDECTSNPDATGLALQALLATLPTDADSEAVIDDAATWLRTARDAEGAYGDPQNVNSTGYAGLGLLADGRDAADQRGFLVATQNDDGGLPISPGGDSDPIATAQALPLLSGTAFLDLVDDVPARVGRLAGDTRRLTAVEVSRADWADGVADTVVLTRDDLFVDALAGTPLAVEANGPLLTTAPTGIEDEVLAEIERVLPEGGTVMVLGGPDALPAGIDDQLQDAGFDTERVFGPTRYETSVEIAERLGDPDLRLLTTALDFADALTAGTAAAAQGGAVLLTEGTTANASVTAYLDATDGRQVAIGGPAAAAYPEAEDIVGETRDVTATLVAREFFDAPATVGIARRDLFADALAGGAHMARLGGPLVLTDPVTLPDATSSYLCDVADGLRRATVFGGPVAVEDDVVATVRDRAAGIGC